VTDGHDVAILGGGSAGERLATTLAGAGRDVVVVERRLVGGECPYFACIPSKAMLISAAARATISAAVEVGAASQPLSLQSGDEAWIRAVRRRDAIAAGHDDADHEKALRRAGAHLLRGRGRITAPGRMDVEGDAGTTSITFEHLVLATGSTPVIPPVEGLEETRPWTSEDAWTARRRPASLLVLGGGAVGCEIAQAFARFGTTVTLVERGTVGAGLEPELAADLAGLLREDGIEVLEGVEVERIRRHDGRVTAVAGGRELDAEQVVVAAGTAPAVDGLGLELLGLDPGDLQVDERLRVRGARHVWAIGDVTAIAPFTHTANHHADVLADVLLGGDRRADHSAIPRAIYTSPEVAGTGLTRAEAREAGIDVAAIAVDLRDTARAAVEAEAAGHLVLVADRARRVLVGASLVSPAAGECITELSLAIAAQVPVDVLAHLVHPFPTWSEGIGPAYAALLEELDGP
jgi:pyruvate/2-oxoglutarate dehydrogenase complex dihydrolipoamide dehydrogenase (E3) component